MNHKQLFAIFLYAWMRCIVSLDIFGFALLCFAFFVLRVFWAVTSMTTLIWNRTYGVRMNDWIIRWKAFDCTFFVATVPIAIHVSHHMNLRNIQSSYMHYICWIPYNNRHILVMGTTQKHPPAHSTIGIEMHNFSNISCSINLQCTTKGKLLN